MSTFTEANTVRDFARDRLAKHDLGWQAIRGNALDRHEDDPLVTSALRDALIRLNPEIAADPDRADEVLYKLRAILVSVRTDGLVRANEEFRAWVIGERTMPFGPNNEHVPVRLVDFDDLSRNQCLVSTEVTMRTGDVARRFDIVLWVNGLPLVVGEAKKPTRPAVSWVDGAIQIHDDYERSLPAFFVPNVLSFATDGKEFRFGSIAMPLELWAPWRESVDAPAALAEVEVAIHSLLQQSVVLDILENFTVYATDRKHRKIKLICRYQQYQAANQLVDRVVVGRIKKGPAYTFLAKHWEALSPDAILLPYRPDYRWLTDVYQSVQPPSGNGKLLWHALGAKTIELINENVHVDLIRDDLETLVLDADVLDEIITDPDPRRGKEVEIKLVKRLRKHPDDPRFRALGERLEELRAKHAGGQMTSLEFLKQLLEIAKEVVAAEKAIEPDDERDHAKAALTELFQSVKNPETPILVERVVNDIDEIVRQVRFPGWQGTKAGEREVQRALRRCLLKYKLHREQELFEKAYGYIRQYY